MAQKAKYTNKDLPQPVDDFQPDSPSGQTSFEQMEDDFQPDDFAPKFDENKFKEWYGAASKKYGLSPDPEGQFYDYRGAFKAGAQPDKSGHWPSEFKQPGHPDEFKGGYSTITGEPQPNAKHETDPNVLIGMGYDPETAERLAAKSREIIANAPEIVSRARGAIPAADTFGEGFVRSILSGEVGDVGLRGGLAYLKKATIGLPESFINGIMGLGSLAGNLYNDPMGTIKGIPSAVGQGLQSMYDTTMQSGSNPEAFGEMMGELTGQPLATAGVMGAAPYAVRGAGYPVGLTGAAMRKYQPISTAVGYKTTGFPLRMPILRGIERQTGRGLEAVGEYMKNFQKGANVPAPATTGPTIPGGRPSAPPPNVPPVAPTNTPIVPPNVPPNAPAGPLIPVAPGETSFIDDILGTPTPEPSVPPTQTPKRRLKLDAKRGSYIDLDTGEEIPINIDKTKPINPDVPETPIQPTRAQPPRTIENAPPNQRAKIMRGAHDPVDVFFENAADRELFGSGQNLFSKNENIRAGIAQRFKDASERIAKQYGLPEQKARELVHGYNEAVRNMSKNLPKYGDKMGDLNFKAPSFEEFLQNTLNPE